MILALQCSMAIHLGVDNLTVVRHVGRIMVRILKRLLGS